MGRKNIALNLGCGFAKKPGMINVDKYDICKPDVVWDLDNVPWPWDDNSVNEIHAFHIFEHLVDWWGAFQECGRILKLGGLLTLEVPHDSSSTSLSYRDHRHEFSWFSFYGADIEEAVGMHRSGTNAWAKTEEHSVPLKMISYLLVPKEEYFWMTHWPFRGLLRWCEQHLNNFMHAQRFGFVKIQDRGKDGRD
jgi:SAM-dependent methyltransferase